MTNLVSDDFDDWRPTGEPPDVILRSKILAKCSELFDYGSSVLSGF
jgi:hypothetical protein